MYGKRKYGDSGSYSRKRGAPPTAFAAKVRRLTAPPATYKKRSAARSIANARIGGFLGIENKFYDTARINGTIASAINEAGGELDPPTVNCISAPAQGDGETQRDGKSIKILSVHLNGSVSVNGQTGAANIDPSSLIYIALVLDKQTNGAQLNSEDVLVNPGNNTLLSPNPLRNLQYSKRFQVLKVVTCMMGPYNVLWDGTNVMQGGQIKTWRMDKKLNLPVTFNNTTAGVASVVDNSLHVIAFTDNTLAPPLLSYNARIRFVG